MYLRDSQLAQKQIVLRCDYNVPLQNGVIQSTKRIDASLPTLHYILEQPIQRLVIISHLGRPKGIDTQLSLRPVKEYLETILQRKVCLTTLEKFHTVSHESIIILENIRFYPEETQDIETTPQFRKTLSELGTVFINDAFGCCHRAHSSIIGINMPESYFGLIIEKELQCLTQIHSFSGHKTLLLGGSKINDKIQLIKYLLPLIDTLLIGGGMAFAFLYYQGYMIGDSLFDPDSQSYVPEIYQLAKKYQTKIVIPVDFLVNDSFSNEGDRQRFTRVEGIPNGYMGLDIGPDTVTLYQEELSNSQCIVWNGPMGVTEFNNFAKGSYELMRYLSLLPNVTTIIGGGDTAACCEQFQLDDSMTHVSTGGGASLAVLEGTPLPGISYLQSK